MPPTTIEYDDSHPDCPWAIAVDGTITHRFASKEEAEAYLDSLEHSHA